MSTPTPFDQEREVASITEAFMKSREEMAALIEQAEQLDKHIEDQQAQGHHLRWVGADEEVVKTDYLAKLEDYLQRYVRRLYRDAGFPEPQPGLDVPAPDPVPPVVTEPAPTVPVEMLPPDAAPPDAPPA